MSVLDRQQITPDGLPPSAVKSRVPWVGVLIALLVIGLIVVGTYLLWPQAQATPETVPSPEISIPATYPEAPEATDIEAAKAAYMAYNDVSTRLGKNGRVSGSLKEMEELTTGKAWKYEQAEAKEDKKNGFIFGRQSTKTTIKSAKLGSDGTVLLRVCIDQRDLTAVDKKGKKIEILDWVSSKATMKKVGDAWKLADRDDTIEEKPCT